MSALDSLYQQMILEHAKSRYGADLPTDSPAVPGHPGTGQSHQLNPVCGDEITLRVQLEGDRVGSVHWHGEGCAISMASASVLSELAEGKSPAELLAVMDGFRAVMRSRGRTEPDEDLLGDAAAFAGVSRYPARVKCAMLSWVAAEDALRQAVGTP
jgi:nitrogen fixation protein NifU and related proteins